MEDFLKQAIEIVKAQASVRNMNEEEITSMIKALAGSIRGIAEGIAPTVETGPVVDPQNAIRETSVICCGCGKSFKVLTKRHLATHGCCECGKSFKVLAKPHLATHGLAPKQYREKFGYKKGTPLVAKSLARDRRKTMQCIGLRFYGHVLSLIRQPRSWPLFGRPGRLRESCSHDAQRSISGCRVL